VALLEEAQRAYKLNIGLFNALRPSNTQQLSKDTVNPHNLPVQTTWNGVDVSRGNFFAHARNKLPKNVFSIDNVLLVVLAVGLGQFLLVIGGFMSSRWCVNISAFDQVMSKNGTATEVLGGWWTDTATV
jgi:hypothetical protein